MTREELEKRLESVEKQFESAGKQMIGLQDEIQNLKAKLAEMQDEPEIPDFPVYSHEPLYFVNHRSAIIGDESNICNGVMRGNFNAFHTKEYAQEYADKCKLIAMMLHCKWYCDKEVVTDFSDDAFDKWCVWYDHFSDEWSVDSQLTHESTTVYFTTEEAAQKCAEWLNENWRDSE